MFSLLWCHPVVLITSVSSRRIQNAMSSRAITILSFGRSTDLDYNGNLLASIPITLPFMSLRRFKVACVHTLLLCYQGSECMTLSFPHTPNSRWRRTGSLGSGPPLTSAALLRATVNIQISTSTNLQLWRLRGSPKRKVQEQHKDEKHIHPRSWRCL